MYEILIVIVVSLFIILLIPLVKFWIKKQNLDLYKQRDYFDKILKEYIKEAYESIYSKHVLPFIANNVTINPTPEDQYFVAISKIFLEVLETRLGNMLKDIYLRIYTPDQFRDYVLLELALLLQADMVDTVLTNNFRSTFNNEINETENIKKEQNLEES